MKKFFSLTYGVVCYLAFLGTILYAVGFTGNLVVPNTIDGEPEIPLALAVFVDASLLLVVALQQTFMWKPGFKKWWTKSIPSHLQRSSHILMASLCVLLGMWQWQPIGGLLWSIENNTLKNLLFILYFSGWFIVFFSTFLINHFDVFGLRQVWLYFNGKQYAHLQFGASLFYKFVRHPLYLGFLIIVWAAPVMTLSHFLFAVLTTGYIFAATQFEEKDLQILFGTYTGKTKATYL